MLKTAKDIRSAKDIKTPGLRPRFWSDVSVRDVDGFLQVYLDQRPLRHPTTKEVIRVPRTKANLAAALAIEWDSMTSTQEAAKQHLVPLTSLVCRAIDIQADDQLASPSIRQSIVTTLLAYLDTDALLCWAPPAGPHDILNAAGESLRDVQKRTTDEVVSFLTTRTWPGIQIRPVLDGHSIVPQRQAEGVREVVQGWVAGLDAWELAGLERAVLAGKSLVTAARLVAQWSEGAAAKGAAAVAERLGGAAAEPASEFGAEEAAKAASLEVDWQATQWGEVEDTHDVNNEDVRRQLASVILLVSGSGRP